MYGPTLNTVYKPGIPGWLKIKKSWKKYRKGLFPWLLDSQDLPMKRNWERLDSLVWSIEGRGEIWFKSGKSFMDMIMWIKTNGLAQPMHLVKMKDKPECPVILWIWSYLLCTPKYEETFLVQELSIYGMIFNMKSKALETGTFSKTSLITGWIPEQPMKSEKKCFKLSHP